jgi:hypothetical protein
MIRSYDCTCYIALHFSNFNNQESYTTIRANPESRARASVRPRNAVRTRPGRRTERNRTKRAAAQREEHRLSENGSESRTASSLQVAIGDPAPPRPACRPTRSLGSREARRARRLQTPADRTRPVCTIHLRSRHNACVRIVPRTRSDLVSTASTARSTLRSVSKLCTQLTPSLNPRAPNPLHPPPLSQPPLQLELPACWFCARRFSSTPPRGRRASLESLQRLHGLSGQNILLNLQPL